ncbi:nuclear transport factor 2 family protein [Chitinophaga sp.]|uniref:nuclear transport factor 2 family protein n=1 Tax=Chitinophaga sp. TaxID=1869181 RepID=UPI0031D6CC86
MKKACFIPLLLLLICSNRAAAQSSEEEAVKSAIRQLFDGMKKGDSAMVKDVFDEKAIMQTVITPPNKGVIVRSASIQQFITAVGTPHTDVWDERITFDKIMIDGPLASVWTPYSFYLGSRFSHCGVNSFQLCKSAKGWKIIYLVDTRRKESCL